MAKDINMKEKDGKEKYGVVSAAEARDIANDAGFLLKRMYKLIKECAKEGQTAFDYGFSHPSTKMINTLVETLRLNGYTVRIRIPDDNMGSGYAEVKSLDETKAQEFIELTITW